MNCWEILGINPTDNTSDIAAAYERQKKFASNAELEQLEAAYREATGQAPESSSQAAQAHTSSDPQGAPPVAARELSAEEHQVVREVVIQIRALLNDSRRANDDGIWKAILTEPPADSDHVRREIARALETQVRPMAVNGSFPAPVVNFLTDWFNWTDLQSAASAETRDVEFQDSDGESPQDENQSSQQDLQSFWPAVIGWIVALAVLAMIFDGLLGGG